MSARVQVALAGAIAFVVLARTAVYYAHTDGLGLALVLVMALSLAAALAELLARTARASRLAGELASLPRPATPAVVEASSEALRPLLRARVNGSAVQSTAPLAGYVVGLLVMLGLLGTFLGLFETLRGAREALTTAGDVDALRAGLVAPMQGLTRSFGTSAAGVAASAMLGLAAALTRRAESRFAQALASYAAEALAPLTTPLRQLAVLAQIAAQSEALPRLVSALEATAGRLSSLEASWARAQAEASRETSAALRDAVERATGDVRRAVGNAITTAEGTLSPLVARAVEGTVVAARKHVDDLGARLDADREARRAEDATRLREHRDEIARLAASEAERAKELAARLDADREARRAEDATRQREHRDEVARMAASEGERARELAARWAEATRSLEAAVEAAETRGSERDATFARTAAELASAAERAIASASDRLAHADARGEEHAAKLDRLLDAVAADRAAAVAAENDERAAAKALLAQAAERAEAFDRQIGQAHASLVDEVARGLASHAARALELEEGASTALAAQATELAASVQLQASEREKELGALAAAVREAAAGVQGGTAELAGVAAMFAGAVDRHREGAAEWLAALGTVEGAIARAGNEAAGRALGEQLDRTRELFDAQLQFHRELLLQLRRPHPGGAAGRRERQDEDGSV